MIERLEERRTQVENSAKYGAIPRASACEGLSRQTRPEARAAPTPPEVSVPPTVITPNSGAQDAGPMRSTRSKSFEALPCVGTYVFGGRPSMLLCSTAGQLSEYEIQIWGCGARDEGGPSAVEIRSPRHRRRQCLRFFATSGSPLQHALPAGVLCHGCSLYLLLVYSGHGAAHAVGGSRDRLRHGGHGRSARPRAARKSPPQRASGTRGQGLGRHALVAWPVKHRSTPLPAKCRRACTGPSPIARRLRGALWTGSGAAAAVSSTTLPGTPRRRGHSPLLWQGLVGRWPPRKREQVWRPRVGLDYDVVLPRPFVPRPIHVSRWAIAAAAPKPTSRMLAPGTVYFFERTDGKPSARPMPVPSGWRPSADVRRRASAG